MDYSPAGPSWEEDFSRKMEFSRQKYSTRLPFPMSGDLPNPRTKPESLASPALAGIFFTTVTPGKPELRSSCVSNHHNFHKATPHSKRKKLEFRYFSFQKEGAGIESR